MSTGRESSSLQLATLGARTRHYHKAKVVYFSGLKNGSAFSSQTNLNNSGSRTERRY